MKLKLEILLAELAYKCFSENTLGIAIKVAQCNQRVNYLMVNKDGVIEEKSQTGFL